MNKPLDKYLNLLKEYLQYNSSTGELTWIKLRPRAKLGPVKDLDGKGYLRVRLGGKENGAHRVCWFLHYNIWPREILDHINGNPLDNRIENLREVSRRQNAQNAAKHRDGKLVGTTYSKASKMWLSRIRIGSKLKYLGYYKTELEAHKAYMKKYEELDTSND